MKTWYKQKGILGGIGAILTGVYLIWDGKYAEGCASISVGLSLIGNRQAVERKSWDERL